MQELILVRGLPGSGKSTYANHLIKLATGKRQNMMHTESDVFFLEHFIDPDTGLGDVKYVFNRKLLGAAHDACYASAIRTLARGHSAVVANNFITVREIDRYVNGVRRCGLEHVKVQVIKMTAEFGSENNVPDRVIEDMRDRWENYPGEIEVNTTLLGE